MKEAKGIRVIICHFTKLNTQYDIGRGERAWI